MTTRSAVLILSTLLLPCALTFAAGKPFSGNPAPAYPPGCISAPLRDLVLNGGHVALFHSEWIELDVVHRIKGRDNLGAVRLDLYRVACAEANRSVIVAEFRLPPEWVDPRNAQLVLPGLRGIAGGRSHPFEFRPEAHSLGQRTAQSPFTRSAFGDYTGGWYDPRYFRWRYVLEMNALDPMAERAELPLFYNSAFRLDFHRTNGERFHSVNVPPTSRVHDPAPNLPLGGRLSGIWVEPGIPDQGLLISFSSLLPDATTALGDPRDLPLLAFVSWFTYDSEGAQLWLTGAADFAQGASEVPIPLELVTQGEFLGSASAMRVPAGLARLKAVNCNRLELAYELDGLGLGSDVMRLERLFALETADFPCRDYGALQSARQAH